MTRHRALTFVLTCCVTLPVCAADRLASLAQHLLGANQGVYVEAADGTVLLAQAAARAVHPASVSKVPTTLALLRRLGPDYRFTTTIAATGPLSAGTLQGDLVFEGSGDPYFVDENALLVSAQLRQLGVRRVSGTVRTAGAMMFNWREDAPAPRLRAALGGQAPQAAWDGVRTAFPDLPVASSARAPALEFGGAVAGDAAAVDTGAGGTPLLLHRSQPLIPLVKALNDYSNNIFKPLADAAGGAAAVQDLARASVPAQMRDEIILGDGAGTDARNRLSPRVVVKLLRALEAELARSGHTLVDILPVAGIDDGTLHDRLDSATDSGRVVGKTGTFGDYGASALIGAIATRDRGTVYFAILNHGVPVRSARRRQDAFVHTLLATLDTLPWPYQRDARPAVARAQVLPATQSASR